MARRHSRAELRVLLWALPLVLLGASCTPRRFTKAGADREVYGLLGRERAVVPEVVGTLDIEAGRRLVESIRRRDTFRLTLSDALALGTVASREYRSRREDVFLAALDLTRQLNAFNPQWFARGSAGVSGDGDGSTFDGSLAGGLERAFERGGSLVIGLASDFLRNLSGDPLKAAQSILSASLVLPLLRGSGRLVAREPLLQAERDTLYALRSYARFQQEFTVDIATRFYRSLQSRDSWKNAEARYESLKLLVAELRAKSVDRVPPFEVDQVEQDLLESDDARQRARNAFEAGIDRLKLDLGIPVSAEVVLDDSDLERLRRRGPPPASHSQADGLVLAAQKRLDLLNARGREEDARRRVRVVRDALRAGLDLRIGGDLSTPGDRPFDFEDATESGSFGIDLDLPLERTEERNAYRRAILLAERARRDRERLEDTIVFEVRDGYRGIAEAESSYEIQEVSLKLAERRVEATQLLLEARRAQTRDRLEAEDALVRARNAVTAALVDHALARLALERDVGTLRVDPKGMWTMTDAPPPTASPGTTEGAPDVQPTPPGTPAPAPAPTPAPTPKAPSGPGALPPPQVIPRSSGTVGR